MLSSHLHCMMRNKQAFGNNCWVASAILNCQNLHFMLRDFNCHVILLHHVKFHCRVIVKTHFQYGGRPPSTFINFHFVVTLLPRVRNLLLYTNLSPRYDVYNDFQNGCCPPSWIFEICSVCRVTASAMLFCFPKQNFTAIGLTAAELWPKNNFTARRVCIVGYAVARSLSIRPSVTRRYCV